MKNTELKNSNETKTTKRWKKLLFVLSCFVVFCTVYALIIPAKTLQAKPQCGLEEHVHSQECYSDTNELICGNEEHQHTDSCDQQEDESNTDDAQSNPVENTQSNNDSTNMQQPLTNEAEENTESESQVDSTLKADSFNLSENLKYVENTKLEYKDSNGNWQTVTDGALIQGTTFKLTVDYQNVSISELINNYNHQMSFDLPDFLRDVKTEGTIVEGNTTVGTVTIQNNKIMVQFDAGYLDRLSKSGQTTI